MSFLCSQYLQTTIKSNIMSYIASIFARQILDSRGNPTVEVDVITDDGVLGRAAVGPLLHVHQLALQRRGDRVHPRRLRRAGTRDLVGVARSGGTTRRPDAARQGSPRRR